MDIYPEDLEPACRTRLQQARDRAYTSTGKKGEGRIYGVLAGFLPGCVFLGAILTAVVHTDAVFFLGGVAGSALGYAGSSFVDRYNLSRQHTQEVTAEEISLARKAEADPLKKEHLGLVFKLITMRPFQDTAVERSIRSATRDIGASIAHLPGQPAEELLLNAETFKEEADRLMAEAAHEGDSVVSASLQRQANARNQRAEAIARNSALARRNQVLRHEMSEQIQALKTMLDAMSLEDSGAGHDLAALAENIEQIATEARSLTEAKKELAFALGEGQFGSKSVTLEQPQIQRMRTQ